MDKHILKKGLNIIHQIRHGKIIWKPGKDIEHLNRRKKLNHLPNHYTLNDYNKLIKTIASANKNELYLFYKEYFNQSYFAIGDIKRNWEIIVGENGVMETAYEIIDAPYKEHFEKKGYVFLGTLKEVEANVND